MKKITTTLLIMIGLMTTKSYAWFDKPTAEDYILQTGFIGLMLVDWKQTNWISDNPIILTKSEYDSKGNKIEYFKTYKESNLILGKYPSKKKIGIYFSSCIVGHTAIAFILPKHYRNLFQTVGIGIEIYATTNNYNCGVKIKF
jgi:hypothetical protein